MALSDHQARIVKATVPVLEEHGLEICEAFYNNMLQEETQLKGVFNQSNLASKKQPRALAHALLAYAANLDDLDVLSPVMEHICQRHASLAVQSSDYQIVGNHLLRAMQNVLGDAFTTEIADAWTVAYCQLAALMVKRESTLYDMEPSWPGWREFKIIKKTPEADDVVSLELAPVDGKPLRAFLPGQYISVKMHVEALQCDQPRQFSLSDAPNPVSYRITVKKEGSVRVDSQAELSRPALCTPVIHDRLHAGDVVQVTFPRGEFFLDPSKSDDRPVVLLSAGVGLTPLVSILNTMTRAQPSRRISWIHVARNSDEHIFKSHVEHIAHTCSNVTKTVFYSKPLAKDTLGQDYDFRGRLALEKLTDRDHLCLGGDMAKVPIFLICGPSGFMQHVSTALHMRGVSEGNIQVELFETGALSGS